VDPKLLYPLKHRGEDSQAHKAIVRSRQALVDCRTQLVNHVPKERSNPSGPACPSAPQGASTRGSRSTSRRPFGPGTHTRADRLADGAYLLEYERQLETVSEEHYPETQLLRQVEGIGPLTALTFVLTLEDPYRFERSRSVGAYLGLVPATEQSGERDPQKRIFRKRARRCLA
jgi:transposase